MEEKNLVENGVPSRQVRLSKFDSQGTDVTWKNKEEQKGAESSLKEVEAAFSTILKCLGDPNPEREGLKRTPHRAAKALFYFTKGYEEDVKSWFN